MSKQMLVGLLQLDLEESQDSHEIEMTEAIDKLNSIRESLKAQLTQKDIENFEFVVNQINYYDAQMIAADKAAHNVLRFICQHPCIREEREKIWDNQSCETVSDSIVDGLKKIMELCNLTMGEVESRTIVFDSYVAHYYEQVCEYIDKKRLYDSTRQSAEFFRKSIKKSLMNAEKKGNPYADHCSKKVTTLLDS